MSSVSDARPKISLFNFSDTEDYLDFGDEGSIGLMFAYGSADRLGFQGQKQLPPFSDPLKSEGRQGLYSLSVDGRSERKEGILEDSMG